MTISSLPPWLIDLKQSSHRIYIHTAGCTYNHGDSHKLQDILRAHHISTVDSLSEATAVIVNTCTVIAKTEREMLRIFREVTKQEKALYITGCMPVVQREEILEIVTPIFITSDEIHALHTQVTHRCGVAHRPFQNNAIAIVQIASGCLGTCQYCLTRFARGPLVSVPVHQICSEISFAISNGAVEIQLTAQDMSAYGMDRTGHSQLAELLHAITEIAGDFRIRVGMMNPRTLHPVAKEVAAAFSHKKIFSFAHIPIQAATDHLLAAMDRGYTVSTFLDTIHLFEQTVPDLLIGTDIIVGFPGETENDIDALLSLLQTIKPYRLNVTRYSPRKGTPAYQLYDMPDRFKKERSRRIISTFHKIRSECNKHLIQKEFEVYITEKKEKGGVMARTDSYHAIVIQSDERQQEIIHTLSCGDHAIVKITDERVHYLVGNLCNDKDRC
ncbi:MAG: tRNA (N(6)-L-threonylcarbamoyladenosine(37)-C(2))-methylthiotransferase [Methanomicrobiales archaeon]|nr:tRNA (N(6)-L-threonylcarbamoyladenosine(37)-C(2))-methylthiotransferase [Methanomicrobiales archaeon]